MLAGAFERSFRNRLSRPDLAPHADAVLGFDQIETEAWEGCMAVLVTRSEGVVRDWAVLVKQHDLGIKYAWKLIKCGSLGEMRNERRLGAHDRILWHLIDKLARNRGVIIYIEASPFGVHGGR